MPYSVDLRERVIDFIEGGNSNKMASEVFKVGLRTIVTWKKLKKNTGKLYDSPRVTPQRKIDLDKLKIYIEKHPDSYLREIAAEFGVCKEGIRYALNKLKITLKKRRHYTKKEMKKGEENLEIE